MATLEWKDSYSVGVEAVDHEHRELIELVNRLNEALAGGETPDRISEAFGDLFQSISTHFALEERFMRAHDYDELAAHKSDHERLLDELRDMMDTFEESGPGDDRAAQERFIGNVEAWFVNHFGTHDARLHHRLGDHPH